MFNVLVIQLGRFKRLRFKPFRFLGIFLRIFLAIQGVPCVANLIFIDCPSPKLNTFFSIFFYTTFYRFFYLVTKKHVVTKSNFQHSKVTQIFLKNIFFHFKNIGKLISTGSPLEVPESLNPSLLQQAWIQARDIGGKHHFLGLKGLISSPQKNSKQN